MKARERIIWACLLMVIVAVCVFANYRYQNDLNVLEHRNRSLSDQNTELSGTIIDLQNEVRKYQANVPSLSELNATPSETLRLEDSTWTPKNILSDLKRHNDLIPYEGVLGGKMGFYDDEKIFLLTDRWVLAWFDDGHIAGYMLLKYQINKDEISWKVMDSYLL